MFLGEDLLEEDWLFIAEEWDEPVTPGMGIIELRNLIVNSEYCKEDPEILEIFSAMAIEERQERERKAEMDKESERRKREHEAEMERMDREHEAKMERMRKEFEAEAERIRGTPVIRQKSNQGFGRFEQHITALETEVKTSHSICVYQTRVLEKIEGNTEIENVPDTSGDIVGDAECRLMDSERSEEQKNMGCLKMDSGELAEIEYEFSKEVPVTNTKAKNQCVDKVAEKSSEIKCPTEVPVMNLEYEEAVVYDSKEKSEISEEFLESERDSEGEREVEVLESELGVPLPSPLTPTSVNHGLPIQCVDLIQGWDLHNSYVESEASARFPGNESVSKVELAMKYAVGEVEGKMKSSFKAVSRSDHGRRGLQQINQKDDESGETENVQRTSQRSEGKETDVVEETYGKQKAVRLRKLSKRLRNESSHHEERERTRIPVEFKSTLIVMKKRPEIPLKIPPLY